MKTTILAFQKIRNYFELKKRQRLFWYEWQVRQHKLRKQFEKKMYQEFEKMKDKHNFE